MNRYNITVTYLQDGYSNKPLKVVPVEVYATDYSMACKKARQLVAEDITNYPRAVAKLELYKVVEIYADGTEQPLKYQQTNLL